MNAYSSTGWRLIEEAVIRDRGYDEESVLTAVLQSYFVRNGYVNSLKALNEEIAELGSQKDANVRFPGARGGSVRNEKSLSPPQASTHQGKSNASTNGENIESVRALGPATELLLEKMQGRKCLQVLCLNEAYEEASALIPCGSELKVKLLAMEGMKRAKKDQSAAISFLCRRVGPLVSKLSEAVLAHNVFIDFLSTLTGANVAGWEAPTPCEIAQEVNDSLLKGGEPSALDVLLSWSEWQEAVKMVEGLDREGKFPFPVAGPEG
uniref:Uncharacterized protein TCIL3000_5_4000 n=1 Tax=Trypanosoma congolense (strain IL3000) TaxID=1068625 RepID=G0ULZ1_TRYCI|nr:unnamed protein product [Trypanosoma congolense IL3000]